MIRANRCPDTSKDCAGAILYSTEKAVEVASEAMQCLGGNGYINGKEALRPLTARSAEGNQKFRLPHGQNTPRFPTVHCRGRHTGDQTDVDWARIQ